MDVARTVDEQIQLITKFIAIRDKFNKEGPLRRSKKGPEYYQSTLKALEDEWTKFDSNDSELRDKAKEDHEYFIGDTYEKGRLLYSKIKATIENAANTDTEKSLVNPLIKPLTMPDKDTNHQSDELSSPRPRPADQPRPDPPRHTRRTLNERLQQVLNEYNENDDEQDNEWIRPRNLPKLPPVVLHKFTGKESEWQTFIELFTSVINNNPTLCNLQKMQYLTTHLEGTPKKILSHLALTNANYESALTILKARYENKRYMVSNYMNSIVQFKKLGTGSAEDIIRLHDCLNACMAGLKNLGYDVTNWDPMLVTIAMQKFDSDTNKAFEESILDITAVPSIPELMTFLLRRFRILRSAPIETQSNREVKRKSYHTTTNESHNTKCSKCGKNHPLVKCFIFKKLSPHDRMEHAKQHDLCFNCLSHDKKSECKSKKTCYTCNKKHHTMLHFDKKTSERQSHHASVPGAQEDESPQQTNAVALHTSTSSVVLPTAQIKICDKRGEWHPFRALLDTGSGDTFISENAAQMLNLPRVKVITSIKGIGDVKAAVCKNTMELMIAPRFPSAYKWQTKALVLPKLSSFLPSSPIKAKFMLHNDEKIVLADPKFHTPGTIDLIIGAQLYAQVLKTNLKRDKTGLVAQDTQLGWIILGNTLNPGTTTEVVSMISLAEIDRSLRNFWEMDVGDNTPAEHDEECETIFKETHSRQPDGRYQVRLPFKSDNEIELGASKNQAVARFFSMEKKFANNPVLKKAYAEFMTEYQQLGHMTLVNNFSGLPRDAYYLPHHAVFKESSSTTKIRVVFDASAKTSTGASLNTLLHTGPKLQQDLPAILIRWRKYAYVFTADIEKMFRQITLHEEDRDYHRILWRDDPHMAIQEFQLNTVTYGTGPATYLSVRTLLQLADDEGDKFPHAAKTLRNDFYVDDMLTGAHSIEEAKTLHHEITKLMTLGKFNLRKWTSNSQELLEMIPEDMREKGIIQIKENETIIPLGIHLNPTKDTFQFTINIRTSAIFTKRGITSEIASIFDPIGWLAPVILRAKMIIQMLWKEEVGWDQRPSQTIIKRWNEFRSDIMNIQQIRIPRWIRYTPEAKVELHGFADASEKAFAACVYIRVTTNDNTSVHLLMAKTRVAPQKGKISLPRLELCGAVLLTQLMQTTIKSLDMPIQAIYAWSDSEITLAWINKDPTTWQTYIANRVSKIHQGLPKEAWRHVRSEDNPADIASRGTSAALLHKSRLWWRGPSWLSKPHGDWPTNNRDEHSEMIEQEIMKNSNSHFSLKMFTSEEHVDEAFNSVAEPDDKTATFLKKFSTFNKLIIVIACLLRFASNSKADPQDKMRGYLTAGERQKAKRQIIRLIQQIHFSNDIRALKNNKPLPPKSKIKALNPFLEDGILRVGGRIHNSLLPSSTKNPILLPRCHTTDNIIRETHQDMLHAGPQLTLNQLRSQYWIIKGVSYVKGIVNKCVRCTRCAPKTNNQLMGNLPSSRVTPAPPFSRGGVDYAGPITTRRNKGRGNINEKSYIAIFVCLVTKAMHIEAVSDLTTEAFLAALRRFISRRGKPNLIMSDNGTNFVGAKRILDKEMAQAIKKATEDTASWLAREGTEWRFIPPGTPHFGGLWEAAVKSVKHHLIRVIGLSKLTFEELTTLLTQIEACVNSRPLAPISNNPDDIEALTPGHFLIGREITAPPQQEEYNCNPTNRWRQVTRMKQQLWKRWSQEYLTTLQQRTKWRDEKTTPEVGDLVLLKEDNSPPLKWPMARVIKLHPGKDGLVRVVTIISKNQKYKQAPIHKLIQLPVQRTEESPTTQLEPDETAEPSTSNTPPKPKDAKNESNNSSEAPQPTGTIPRRPTTRSVTRSTLITILYFMTLLTTIFAHNYTITSPEPGLYIEKLGIIHLSRGKLRMEMSFPRTSLEEEGGQATKVWNQTQALCEGTKELVSDTQCHILMRHLTHERNLCQSHLEEIKELSRALKPRTKRGLFGKVIKLVFGTDEDDLYTHLDALGHNHNALLQTMNQQTLLLNTRISQSNEITQQRLNAFNDRAQQLRRAIEDMKPWNAAIDRNRLEIHMLTTYLGALSYLEELRERYETLLRVLTGKGTGIELLTRSQIDANIEAAHKKLGPTLMISKPTPQPTSFKTTKEALFIYVYFQIVETKHYEVIHTTPIPYHLHNNTFALQDIKHPLVGADYHRQRYFVLKDADLERCHEIHPNERICEVDIVYEMPEHPSCVIDEIFNKHEGVTCPTKKVIVKNTIWKKLNTENTWFYMTEKPTIVAIMCGGYREEVLLNTTGILHVKRDCFIKTKSLTLRTNIDMKLQASDTFNRIINLTEVNTTRFKEQPPIKIDSSNIIKRSENIFAEVAPVPTVIPLELSPTPKHTPYTITGVVACIILLIILWKTKGLWLALIRKICTHPKTEERQKTTPEEKTLEALEAEGRITIKTTPLSQRIQRILGSQPDQEGSAGPQDVQDEHAS